MTPPASSRTDQWLAGLFLSAWAGWLFDLIGNALSAGAALHEAWWASALGLTAGFSSWVMVLIIPMAAGSWLFRCARGARPAGRLLAGGAILLAWSALFTTAVNWILFDRTGAFIGIEGWRFFGFNPGQVLAHILQVEGPLLGLIAALSLAMAAIMVWLIGRACRRLDGRRQLVRFSAAWAILGAAAIAVAIAIPFKPDRVRPLRQAVSLAGPWSALSVEGADRVGIAWPSGELLAAMGAPANLAADIPQSRKVWVNDPALDTARLEMLLMARMKAVGYTITVNPATGRPIANGTRVRFIEAAHALASDDPAAGTLPAPISPSEPVSQTVPLPDVLLPALTQEKKRIRPMAEYLQSAGNAVAPPYNVIVILVESLRADRLAVGGIARTVMPNLDALAARSVAFTRAYSQSSHSNYADLCVLTSAYPLRSYVPYYYPVIIPYPRVLLYDILSARGYRTAVFSSQDESWGGMVNFLNTGSLDTIFHSGTFTGPTYVAPDDVGFALRWLKGKERAGKIEDRRTVHAALDWIAREPDRPFFCYLNLQDSHFPYLWEEGQPAAFQPADLDGLGVERMAGGISFFGYPREHLDRMRNRYDSSLHSIDELLGKLMAQLTVWGVSDRTILVVTGDQGEMLYEHGVTGHANELWQEVLRVPLILHAPGLAPRRIDRPVQHVDVAPTVLGLLGLPPHPAFQGRDALKEQGGTPSPIYSLAQTPWNHQASVIWNGYKLLYDYRHSRAALYNLESDPQEHVDLIGEQPAVAGHLREMIRRWYLLQLGYYNSPEIHTRYYPPD